MINPTQNQPPNPPVPNAVIGSSPPEKKPRQLLPSKFPLLVGAAAIGAIVLGVILAVIIPRQETNPSFQQTTATNTDKLPEKGLASANGQITAVFPKDGKITIQSLSPRPDGSIKYWTVTITSETILAKFSDWRKTSPSESTIATSLPKTDAGTKGQLHQIGLSDLKIGDYVYLMARQGQDLATMDEIEGPSTLLLQ